MYRQYGEEFNIAPEGYILPSDYRKLQRDIETGDRGSVWILKPNASACGRGIRLFDRNNAFKVIGKPNRSCLVQRYISNPLLLDGYKFDLRLYVVVTSFDPLRVYIYKDGLARFATTPYSLNTKSLTNRFRYPPFVVQSILKINSSFFFSFSFSSSSQTLILCL